MFVFGGMQLGKEKMEKWSTVQLHCRECGARMMDYTLIYEDERIVLQGLTIKCSRCKRVMMLKKYTEGMIRAHVKKGVFRI